MLRFAPWAMALALLFGLTSGPAHARRNHVDVFVAIGNHPAFVHPFFHRPFFFHRSFHSAFFVEAPVFAPPPLFAPPPAAVVYPPPAVAYYPPPPGPTYQPPPTPPSRSENCRQYQTTIDIDGQPQPLVGTVCKGPDGNWHTVQ
jgi:hypothetical protein